MCKYTYKNRNNALFSTKRRGCRHLLTVSNLLIFSQKLYNRWDFKACEARETAVYWDVNEDFECERNTEIILLDDFYLECKLYLGVRILTRPHILNLNNEFCILRNGCSY